MTKVSIALCTYNGAAYITEQLESFDRQTRLPDEIIICDDGSKDNTIDLIKTFAQTSKIPIQLHRNEKNLGFIQNFSQAVSLTTGDIIFLSDQDDIWHESKVEKFLQAFEKTGALVISSDCNLVDETLNPLGQTFWQLNEFDRTAQAFMQSNEGFQLALQRNVLSGNAMAIAQPMREIFLPIPMVNLTHDIWLGLLAVALQTLRIIPEPLHDYRQHQKQASSQKKVGFISRFQVAYGKLQSLRNALVYEKLLEQHQALRDRLQQVTRYPVDSKTLEMLDAKILYLKSQVQLHQRPFFLRPPILYQELASGRYARFSRGWKHLVVDLLL